MLYLPGKEISPNWKFLWRAAKSPVGKNSLVYVSLERSRAAYYCRKYAHSDEEYSGEHLRLQHYCGRDLQDRPIIPFGGRVYVVKCDESQFKHKSKVSLGFALSTYVNFPPTNENRISSHTHNH